MCKWFCQHKEEVQAYLDDKNPTCKPAKEWWVYVALCETIIREVNITFVTGQGLTTTVGEQVKQLDKLKQNLIEIVGAQEKSLYEELDDCSFIQSNYVVKKETAVAMIKDCGRFYELIFEASSPSIQKDIWQDASKFTISIVEGIQEIEQQHSKSSGSKVPPVMPYDLVQLRSYEFNKIIEEQTDRLMFSKTQKELNDIEGQHRELISAYRSEDTLRKAIQDSIGGKSFTECWACIGIGRFKALKEFCGGLATVFPGTASVESDFSVVGYEKNEYRTSLTDLSLEGILHSKQFPTISKFNQ